MKTQNKNYRRRYSDGSYTIDFTASDFAPEPPEVLHAPAEQRPVDDGLLQFASFGSGSSGNCAYLGTRNGGVLIDAGVDVEHVFHDLLHNGVTPEMVKGIVLTHDHADHVRYAYRIARQYKHIRIYCTPRLMKGLLRNHNISNRIQDYHEAVFKEIPFKLGGFRFTAFDTSHDGSDNMGFFIEAGDRNFVIATDMGIITERAEHYMSQAHFLMIESNYDRKMLDDGRYPEYLKQRVRGEKGHLDNEVAARFVAEHYSDRLEYVFLCHLSNDNNTPRLAIRAMRSALEAKGVTVGDASNAVDQRDRDMQLYALPRYETSTWFIL